MCHCRDRAPLQDRGALTLVLRRCSTRGPLPGHRADGDRDCPRRAEAPRQGIACRSGSEADLTFARPGTSTWRDRQPGRLSWES